MIHQQQDPLTIFDAEFQQSIYRCVLHALSYPGTSCPLPRHRSTEASESSIHLVLCALVDENVTLHADPRLVSKEFINATGVCSEDVQSADFIVASGKSFLLEDQTPKCGTLYRPDASATVILGCESLASEFPASNFPASDSLADRGPAGGMRLEVTGPGVESKNHFAVSGLVQEWIDARDRWCSRYPMGVDILLIDRDCVLGIPRTSSICIVTR